MGNEQTFSMQDAVQWTSEIEGDFRRYEVQREAIKQKPYIGEKEREDLLAEHERKFEPDLVGKRDGTGQAIGGAMAMLDDELEGLQRAGEYRPRDDAQFRQFNERDNYTKDELARIAKLSPGDVLKEFQRAAASGDEVRAALIKKHAPGVLSGETISEFEKVVKAAESGRVDAKRRDALNSQRKKFYALKQRLSNLKTRKEMIELGNRYPSIKSAIERAIK